MKKSGSGGAWRVSFSRREVAKNVITEVPSENFAQRFESWDNADLRKYQ